MSRSEILKLAFGFLLLAIIAGITVAVALGRVEEATSYGLMPLLTMLSTLAGSFCNWAFGRNDKPPDK